MNPVVPDVQAVVVARDDSVPGVAVIELAPRPGESFPSWEPGAHVDVLGPGGLVRQYSLCGAADAATWRLGVRREESSRGGSAWLVDEVRVGATLALAGPRNHFRFDPAGPALLIAGGIGITPIAPMAAAARAARLDYRLHYAGHEGRMALLDELRAAHGTRLVEHVSERNTRLDLAAVLGAADPATRVHCCGPLALVDEAERIATSLGLAFAAERFEPEPLTAAVWQGPFEVELELSGMTLPVPEDRSILEVVEDAGVFVLSSCQEGTCGTCETEVVAGEVDHRDSILTPAERARSDVMYICVSRAACPRLTLRL